ncbi:MAG: Uma2 family endonuclease [Planctomycetales bacterium]|nr:Uma2 family endonuclease [Planctomycetales bacterium]
MSVPQPQPEGMTPQEYLNWERQQRERHEFYAGELFSQAGGTRNHSLIATNTAGELRNFFARTLICTVKTLRS